MSLIDFGKSLHQRAIERYSGNRIVFHHVPKCGGTSAGRALRRAYILSQDTVTPEASMKAFDAAREDRPNLSAGDVSELREMMLLYMLYADTRCVSAHIPFSDAAYKRFAGRYVFVTLLRDPVDRFISNYFWSHQHPRGVGHIAESLEEFLLTKRARHLGSTYVRYFCGEPGQEFTARHVDAAIRNLHRMECVGFLDEVGRFGAALRQLTGKRLRIGRENVRNTSSKRGAILSGPMGRKVLEACSFDKEIWNAVQDLRSRLPGSSVRPVASEGAAAPEPSAVG
jgi:hypothetical protein